MTPKNLPLWTPSQMGLEILQQIPSGSSLNLGIGLPTLLGELMQPEQQLMVHSENGVLGVWGRPKTKEEASPTLINAGKETIGVLKGASFFDSAFSFGLIRGRHLDFAFLGGMQVDFEGNLANWMAPGQKLTGMGGAMDLVYGAKKIFVMMTHFDKSGQSKLLEKCTYPLTGKNVVDKIFTNCGIFLPQKKGFKIEKLAAPELEELLNPNDFSF